MDLEQLIFYTFAGILVFAGGMVITVRNTVHAILYLVLAFFTAAGLFVLLEAEFLAITLVLVYVGAVMVLFLFVVMMLDINVARMREGFLDYLPLGAALALVMVVEMSMLLAGSGFGEGNLPPPPAAPADYSNTKALGGLIYTTYVYPFEIAALILLVAIVAAIALTMRRRPETKYQRPEEQLHIKRADRVELVNIKSENRQ